MRKTVNIKWLIEHVNNFNRTSSDIYKIEREGKNMLLETILHESGCYEGFEYLSARDLAPDSDAKSVGIREQKEDGSWNFQDTDYTRIAFFINSKL